MNLWKNILGKKDNSKPNKDESPFMPKIKEPVEIEFAKNFTEKGGRFLFVENKNNAIEVFDKIREENNWKPEQINCINTELAEAFHLKKSDSINPDSPVLFLTCEFLIANKGGMLICKQQIQNRSFKELPNELIIYASADQFVSDISEGMSKLKSKYFGNLPTNITTLNAKGSETKEDFLTQGNSAKSIYLILQE